jgi:hypothetical protein
LGIAVAQRGDVPVPTLEVDDLAVFGKPDPRAGYADQTVTRLARPEAKRVKVVGRRHASAHHDGAGFFLQACLGGDGEAKVLIAIADCFHDSNAFLGRGADGEEDVVPVLHGHVLAIGPDCLPLDEDHVTVAQVGGGVHDWRRGVQDAVDEGGLNRGPGLVADPYSFGGAWAAGHFAPNRGAVVAPR